MFNTAKKIQNSDSYSVVEAFDLPPKEAQYRAMPNFLYETPVGKWLKKNSVAHNGLWKHQSLALDYFEQGHNIVVSTETASGKSLIFRAAAFHRVLKNPQDKVLVFYPLKALASDQLKGWRNDAVELGLNQETIGRIDGSVQISEREKVLKEASIILMTPDVCQAWLMARISDPVIKNFVRNLSFIIMDEAHTLEGVFGSNFAYLFRRLLAAKGHLSENKKKDFVNIIAASATIKNPADHLKRLTAEEFICIDDKDNGSPNHSRKCIHIAATSGEEFKIATNLQVQILCESEEGFITFVDSRKGVETLAAECNNALLKENSSEKVMPYRAGIYKDDRKVIEEQLQMNILRGVISTSALELGIDIKHLAAGINIGIPSSRKIFRQRLGRIGRSKPGVFIIIAEENAFTRYGSTFKEYYDASVEESYLYLDNRFMQFAHARCLLDEMDNLGIRNKSILPFKNNWSIGFEEVFASARPGGNMPKEFDMIAMIGADSPQKGYPLRNVGEINFEINTGDQGSPLGDATLPQAIRECYPGATYSHMGRPYKVYFWNTNSIRPFIRVKPVKGAQATKPRIRTWINADLREEGVVDQNLYTGEDGMIAECQMQITERVEGYKFINTGEYFSYKDMRESNPNMKPMMRRFRTTGVLININNNEFRDNDVKTSFARLLHEFFCREYSILPQDVCCSATNISINSPEGNKSCTDCVVIFDQTYGSLRLTERAFQNFSELINKMVIAAETMTDLDEHNYKKTLQPVREFETKLVKSRRTVDFAMQEYQGEFSNQIQVFAPKSIVGYREKGPLYTEVEIIEPSIFHDGTLLYQVECRPKRMSDQPIKRFIPADHIEELSGSNWSYAWWNPETQEYVDQSCIKEISLEVA